MSRAAPPLSNKETGARALITYIDLIGCESQREISIRHAEEKYGQVLVHTFCQRRHQTRTFDLSQIVELIDCETGEFVADILAWLAGQIMENAV